MTRISLVLGTRDRVDELRRFLRSVSTDKPADLEVIVVDQNADQRLVEPLREFSCKFKVVHVRSSPGLSHARNIGLQLATGDIIGFPDDDCWYAPGLLQRVVRYFDRQTEVDGLTGRAIDEDGKESSGRFSRSAGFIGVDDVWAKAISFTIFLRAPVCRKVGGFDENLGVGAGTPYGSGEETDYLIRAIKSGAALMYDPELTVFHPNKNSHASYAELAKAFRYGAGMGRVVSKHEYSWRFRARTVVRPVLRGIWAAARLDVFQSALSFSAATGRLLGLGAVGATEAYSKPASRGA